MRRDGGLFRRAGDRTHDPSGFVKGWSVDRGAELLEAAGLRNYAINAGGDIRLGAYATAAFAMGLAGPAWTARLRGYEGLTILADRRVLSTGGFPRALAEVA